MRIAVVADIHGNNFALEAVLEDIARQRVDEVVVAGDSINPLPGSKQVWALLMGSNYTLLQGNHEYYVYTAYTAEAPAWLHSERFQPVHWSAAQFSASEKAQMRSWAWHYTQPDLFITHASQRSLFDNFSAQTCDAELEAFFPSVQASLIVRAHNHHWLRHRWNRRTIWMVNACGMPFGEGTAAPYAILSRTPRGWRCEKRRVRYNHRAALKAMNEEYLHAVGPLGRVFKRELERAEVQILPFFRRFETHLACGEISLEAAVERYLSEG